MASPMDLDICSSPFKDDEDDDRNYSMYISSEREEPSSPTAFKFPAQLFTSKRRDNRSAASPPIQHDIATSFAPASLNSANAREAYDNESTRSYTTSHYQTRWTYTCKHMLIHDDEDPLYPIRVGPRQLHKVSTETCPMCKEQAAAIEEARKKKALEEGEMVRDPPIYGIIKEDILAESTKRRDSLRLAVLAAQRDQVLKYAQFLDSTSELSVQAWGWYDGCNRDWEAKLWEVEKRSVTASNSRGSSISVPAEKAMRSSRSLMDRMGPSTIV